jgi:hypothetical protein
VKLAPEMEIVFSWKLFGYKIVLCRLLLVTKRLFSLGIGPDTNGHSQGANFTYMCCRQRCLSLF